MSFDYNVPASNQSIYTSPAKGVLCRSFRIDLSVTNATNAVAQTIGFLPKGSQIVAGNIQTAVAVSGPSVTAATVAVAVNGRNFISGSSVFATGVSNMGSAVYYTNLPEVVANDVPVTFTLTLTGGTTATAGLMYVNILYVA